MELSCQPNFSFASQQAIVLAQEYKQSSLLSAPRQKIQQIYQTFVAKNSIILTPPSVASFRRCLYSDEQEQSNLIVHLWDCEVLKCKSCGSKSPIFACLGKRLLPKGMCFYMYSITADL